MGPDELDLDDFPIAGSFDPNDTLPQIWESDPNATLPYMLGDDNTDLNSDADLEAVPDMSSLIPSGDTISLPGPRQTRAGRHINIPVRYRE